MVAVKVPNIMGADIDLGLKPSEFPLPTYIPEVTRFSSKHDMSIYLPKRRLNAFYSFHPSPTPDFFLLTLHLSILVLIVSRILPLILLALCRLTKLLVDAL